MPRHLAHIPVITQPIDLIDSGARGNDLSKDLEPVFQDILARYEALCGDLTEDDMPHDIIRDAIIADVSEPIIAEYSEWFSRIACLLRLHVDKDHTKTLARPCITFAFNEFVKETGDRQALEPLIIAEWMKMLRFS